MSHVAEVALIVKDLSALETAAARCGGELMTGQTTHAWWGYWVGDWQGQGSAVAQGRDPKTFGTCLHAIRMAGRPGVNGSQGAWEIGVVARQDGDGFALVYDNYGSRGKELEQLFGVGLAKLSEEYGAEIAMRQLALAGFFPQRIDAVASQGY